MHQGKGGKLPEREIDAGKQESNEQESQANWEKFENEPKILQILETGEIVNIRDIDEVRPELKGHMNVVQLTELSAPLTIGHTSKTSTVTLKTGETTIEAVFKPFSGENQEVKNEVGMGNIHCYQREVAAYLLDKELGFDLVPPTTIREIDGEIGSLQLYIPPEEADNYKILGNQIDDEKMRSGPDSKAMAVFDYITANWERKPENFLVNKNNPAKLYAIDHGLAFASHKLEWGKHRGMRGSINKNKTPEHIPSEILDKIRTALERKTEITNKISKLVNNDYEVDRMWDRAEELVEKGIFL